MTELARRARSFFALALLPALPLAGCTCNDPGFCGDGIVNGEEVCDDGVNDGSYNGCMSTCRDPGPFCGDGLVNGGTEECDDRNDVVGDGCGVVCENELVCSLLYEIDGTDDTWLLGWSLAGGVDFDGDGTQDLLAGAPGARPADMTWSGTAYVFSGIDGAQLFQADGVNAQAGFADRVAYAGDVDMDTIPDLVVGADLIDCTAVGQGGAYVVSGADGTRLHEFIGALVGDCMGSGVGAAGDIDADGYDDVLVGAGRADPMGTVDAGSVYIYSGQTGVLLWTVDGIAGGNNLGRSVGGGADLDGDGVNDVLVGGPLTMPAGVGIAYNPADGTSFFQADGLAAGDQLGLSVTFTGDLDGDAVPDAAFGAPGGDYLHVYSGGTGTLLYEAAPGDPDALFGAKVVALGDLDGDGIDELAAGAPLGGTVWVLSGATGTVVARIDEPTDQTLTLFGSSLAAVGDVDADGLDELAIGAPVTDVEMGFNPYTDAGAVYVFSCVPMP
jgi:cysteine-rich repeat protein